MSNKTIATTQETPATRITDEVLHLSFVSVFNQLQLTLRRINGDDLDRRALENTISLIEQLQADFGTRLNEEADSYNALCDMLDEARAELARLTPLSNEFEKLKLAVSEEIEEIRSNARLKELEAESQEIRLNGEITELRERVTTSQLAYKTLEMAHRTYKRINPESLHEQCRKLEKEISSLRADRKERNKRLQELQGKLNLADREITASRSLAAQTRQDLERTATLYEKLKERVEFHDGKESVKKYTMETTDGFEVSVYIYNFHFGLLAINDKIRGHVLELADFHFQIRTAMLTAMDVIPGVWGNPIFERTGVFEKMWDEQIDEELHQRIMARMALDFPKLYKRVIAGKAAPVDDLNLPAKVITLLKKAGFLTIQAIGSVLPSNLADIKGVGANTAAEITNEINSWCINWAKENGDVEEYRTRLVVQKKGTKRVINKN